MGANSKIEWTDHTFNPWRGCVKVSPGCANCYAETLSHRNPALLGQWGRGKPRVRASEAMWRQPLKWNAEARHFGVCDRCGPKIDRTNEGRCPNCTRVDLWQARRPRVFCASLADWLDDEVPIEWLADLLALVYDTPNLDWLLLTKRPENFFRRLKAAMRAQGKGGRAAIDLVANRLYLPENAWIGVSVENQERANERIPLLLDIPARVRFLSAEPLLGTIDIGRAIPCGYYCDPEGPAGHADHPFWSRVNSPIHWVIVGGESGARARPMHPEWTRSLRDQCIAAHVPFFFKQWGEWLPFDQREAGQIRNSADLARNSFAWRIGKKVAGRMLDGREWSEFPESGRKNFELIGSAS